MLEVLRYIAMNALNTVQKIKAMLKICYTDFNALKAMYVEGVKDVKYYEQMIKGSKYIQTCFCS